MKKLTSLFLFFLILIITPRTFAQENATENTEIYTRPKLVVGVVVDQMRYDYIARFWNRYGDDGFKRLIKNGYFLKNTHYNYVPTFTAPGHTSIYTGTSPRYHGVIGNSFYDRKSGRNITPVLDEEVNPVGTTSEEGKRSPKQLLATTFGDQNRLATEFRGKTIGIALKDRAAILPAGHGANAAYWFVGGKEGKFVTSTYYRDNLPQWVKDFNASGKAASYMKTWNTLYPISSYKESGPDQNNFEGKLGEGTTFPYDLKKIAKEKKYGFGILKRVAYGDDLTTDFALAALDGEGLGKDNITDVLTISYSSTDYVAHRFGVNSKEVEDTYLRLDKALARLLKGLDEKVGKGNYTLFLTADHGGVEVPAYLKSKKIAAGYFSTSKLHKDLKSFLKEKYNVENLIASISNYQVFFDYKVMKKNKIGHEELENTVKRFLVQYPKIAQAYTRTMIENGSYNRIIGKRVKNGFNPERSGDVAYVYEPGVISYGHTGSQHGSAYTYDTHVPLIFYGKGIKTGQTLEPAETIDIAPTITAMLGVQAPNAATGKVLYKILK